MLKKILLIIIIVLGAVLLYLKYKPASQPTTPPETNNSTISTPEITFSVPNDFGLAVSENQILVKSYIPPCDGNFNYCLYYNGSEYQGTNFESAGLKIQKRADLNTQSSCSDTQPDGYNGLTPKITKQTNYSITMYSPLGDAAAGHYTSGALYRVFFSNTCYEFQTRIGETQFANYPPGAIKEFTDTDRNNMKSKLLDILNNSSITQSGEKLIFPEY